MKKILTVTFNPTVDAATEADSIRPTHKVRTFDESYHPGGGGINVARVIHRLGGDVTALYPCGGVMGNVLSHLLDDKNIKTVKIPIFGNTRINNVIHDRSTGMEYRFVAEGPEMIESEWQTIIDKIKTQEWEWLVISGSLPRGVPIEIYDILIDMAHQKKAKIVIDTSRDGLKYIFKKGGLTMVKPSQGEFEASTGRIYNSAEEIANAAQDLCLDGVSDIIAVTLGHQGAILATKQDTLYLPSPHVRVLSASGAGDSFVGGMVYALAIGQETEDAFRLACACGTAAVAEKGTGLCQIKNIKRFYKALARSDAHFMAVSLARDE